MFQYFREYSTFSSDIDLVGDTPAKLSHNNRKARSITIVTVGSGALAVQCDSGPVINLTGLTAGEVIDLYGLTTIKSSGTTVGKIRVGW